MELNILVQNIKARCKANGIPPTVACRDSGAGKDLLSNIKKGQTPSIEKVQQMADYLGCTVSDLLGEEKKPTTVTGDGHAQKLEAALRDIGVEVDSLTGADIRRIAKLAKTLLEE